MEVQSMLRLTNVKVSSRCRFTVEAVEAVNIVVLRSFLLPMMCCFIIVIP